MFYLSEDVIIATAAWYQMKTATKKIYLFFIEFLFVVVSVAVDND